MPGTLIQDEPQRTTQPDLPGAEEAPRTTLTDIDDTGTPPPEAGAEPPPDKPKRAWVYFLIGGLLFMSAAGPLIFYFAVWRYRPTASQHIPPGTIAAVRFDGRELYLYEPFRKHVLGKLQGAAAGGRAQRFKKNTNIDITSDIREVVVATATGETWVVLVGGDFGAARGGNKFEKGLFEFIKGEEITGFELNDGAVQGRGLFIGQAEDTTVVIASSRETLEKALEPSDTNTRLGLASSGAMSFVIDRPAFEAAVKMKPTGVAAFFLPTDMASHMADAFGHTEKMTGYVRFKREIDVIGDITPTQHIETMALTTEYELLQKDAVAISDVLPEALGLKTMVLNAKLKPRAKTVMIDGSWPKDELDAGLEAIGNNIAAIFPKE
jgi:hypothetical protein